MPILHSLPIVDDRTNRLLACYHGGLRRHWNWPRRLVAGSLALLGLGGGWSRAERQFLSPEVRACGLSMAKRRGIHRLLNPVGYPPERNLLRNKALFARHAARHGLPTPATFDPEAGPLGEWLERTGAVIAKPGYSSKGRGIEAFRRDGDSWLGDAGTMTGGELARRLRAVLRRHGVIKHRLEAHDGIADLSPGALPTLRVVTCTNESGEAECGAVVLRLGVSILSPVDNFNAGGIAVRIDGEGRCTAAFRSSAKGADTIMAHPATGTRIVGRAVPLFRPAIALARRAHAALADGFAVVGWDIGLSDRGAVLIEGNWNPGTDIVQLVEGVGLDRTRLGELYRLNLERTPAEVWRGARPIEW